MHMFTGPGNSPGVGHGLNFSFVPKVYLQAALPATRPKTTQSLETNTRKQHKRKNWGIAKIIGHGGNPQRTKFVGFYVYILENNTGQVPVRKTKSNGSSNRSEIKNNNLKPRIQQGIATQAVVAMETARSLSCHIETWDNLSALVDALSINGAFQATHAVVDHWSNDGNLEISTDFLDFGQWNCYKCSVVIG